MSTGMNRTDPETLHLLEQLLDEAESGGSDTLNDRGANTVDLQTPAAPITDGRATPLADNDSYTLFLSADAAVDVRVELSPDDGATAYGIPESPVSLDGTADAVVRISYDANWLRITGSNDTPVEAQLREII